MLGTAEVLFGNRVQCLRFRNLYRKLCDMHSRRRKMVVFYYLPFLSFETFAYAGTFRKLFENTLEIWFLILVKKLRLDGKSWM